MEQRLKNLKQAMNKTAFQKVKFTEMHKQQILNDMSEHSLKQTILSLLTEWKSGVELTQTLHIRGIEQINENEGIIYSILHEAEQDGWLTSYWDSSVKYYQLTKFGKKQVRQDQMSAKLSIKDRILGVRMHAE